MFLVRSLGLYSSERFFGFFLLGYVAALRSPILHRFRRLPFSSSGLSPLVLLLAFLCVVLLLRFAFY